MKYLLQKFPKKLIKISLKKILLLIFIFFIIDNLSAQKEKIDSLQNLLKTDNQDTLRAKTLVELALQFRNSEIAKGKQYAKEALFLSKKLNYKNGLAGSYGVLGLLYYREGQHDLAVDNHLKSLRLFEELGDKKAIGFRYNDLGNVYVEQEFYPRAMVYFEKSLKIKEEINDKEGIATTLKNIINLYIYKKDYPNALKYALEYQSRIENSKNLKNQADLFTFIGEAYLYTNEPQKALLYLEKAKEIRIKIKDQFTLPRVLNDVGKVNLGQGNLAIAMENFEEAAKIAKKNKIKVVLQRIYQNMSDVYKLQKDYQNAYDYSQLSLAYEDSVYSQKTNDKISVLNAIFEDEKAQIAIEKDKKISQAQLEEREVIIFAGIIVVILVSILAVILWFNNIQKNKTNKILNKQNQEIEQQNKRILSSITYAQRIQEAILPTTDDLQMSFPDSFLIYRPRDIVSGDFYWTHIIDDSFSTRNGSSIIAVADCTGHGVPGAFMSMIGNDLLNKIIIEKRIYSPEIILTKLHEEVRAVLNKDRLDNIDGMEIAICIIDANKKVLQYAGAMLPLYLYQKDKGGNFGTTAKIILPDKKNIGGRKNDTEKRLFTRNEILLEDQETTFFMSSDGYQDQMGGDLSRKFMSKVFKQLLADVSEKDIKEQYNILEETHLNWKREYNQTDDIVVVGVKI